MPWIVCEASSLWLAGISVCQHLPQLTGSQSSSFSGSRESHPTQVQLCICTETCEDPLHFSVVFHYTASFSLIFVGPAHKFQQLSSPNPASLGLHFPTFGPQGPLSWKQEYYGTNLCISLLSMNTAPLPVFWSL